MFNHVQVLYVAKALQMSACYNDECSARVPSYYAGIYNRGEKTSNIPDFHSSPAENIEVHMI